MLNLIVFGALCLVVPLAVYHHGWDCTAVVGLICLVANGLCAASIIAKE